MERMKAAQALITYYVKKYTEKYGTQPNLNRYREKYGMADVVDSVGYDRGKVIMDYYFDKVEKPGHPIIFYFYNFDKIDTLMKQLDEENIKRKEVMRRTAERVKEFNELRSKTD